MEKEKATRKGGKGMGGCTATLLGASNVYVYATTRQLDKNTYGLFKINIMRLGLVWVHTWARGCTLQYV